MTDLPTDELILVFDAGTQSIRAVLIDPRGTIFRIVKIPINPYFSTQPGWAEQAPDLYWQTLAEVSQKLLSDPDVDQSRIAGVTLTCQRATVVNLDRHGNPLRPAILWLDQRKARPDIGMSPFLRSTLKLLRRYDTAEKAVRECKSNWIRQHQPELWDRTTRFLLLSGFLIHRLTGQYRESTGSIVGYLPFDYKRHRWARSRDLKWQLFPMDRAMLPELVPPAGRLGQITRRAAAVTGIPEGLPVIAAATDKACEVLGAGCRSPETACLSYGTTATVNTANTKYVEIKPLIPPFPGALPGTYNTEAMVYRGFWMISWFKKEFGLRECHLARQRGVAPEAVFDELIADIPPGAMGLTLQPYWSPGLNTDADAKGAIIGFGDVHTRAHIYRAILEGLAYGLKDGMQILQKRNRRPVQELRISGGGSQSDAVMQITADIFGRPARRPHTFETAALGAAIDAAVGLKLHPDFNSAIRAMTRFTDAFIPIPANRDRYHELYERVYRKMYARLKPIYNEIRAITGYPAT